MGSSSDRVARNSDLEIAGLTVYLGFGRFADEPRIHRILVEHAVRGVRIQALLRVFLAAFVLLTVCLDPPNSAMAVSVVTGILYAAWCIAGCWAVMRHARFAVRWSWVGLPVDLLLMTILAVIASMSNDVSWTINALIAGFALVPMIAAVSLQPRLCALVVAATVVVYAVSTALSREANGEPWSVVVLRVLVIAALAVGAVLLAQLNRSRVITIGSLAAERAQLLDETMTIEERERGNLAESLHDGALQYILAARQELATLRDWPTRRPSTVSTAPCASRPGCFGRTLSELHPAVLEQAGLAVALTDLSSSYGNRAGAPTIAVDTAAWPSDLRTSADSLLFATARELLTNVIKHAGAENAEVTAEFEDSVARLVVLDDGVGLPGDVDVEDLLQRRQASGHIGLASRRVRIEGLGGRMRLENRPTGGLAAIVEMPARRL